MGNGNNPRDKVVSLASARQAKGSGADFATLPLAEQLDHLRRQPAGRQLKLITRAPRPKELVRNIPEQELYWLVKEIGEADAGELLELASPEQRTFILDMELWERGVFSAANAYRWLGHLLDVGESVVTEQLPELDPELLVLALKQEISVGGGIGELASDDERTADWDHSFDNIYFITFKNPRHAQTIGAFLDIAYRTNHGLYLELMEGIKGEIGSELEELALQFRTGRLADLGFPNPEAARSIYGRLDPASFTLSGEKKLVGGGSTGPILQLPSLPGPADSLLNRALSHAGDEGVSQELAYLAGCALVADDAALHERAAGEEIFRRVHGYLNIALEYLAGNDVAQAATILVEEPLKRLFQLGFSIVLGLRTAATGLASDDYATGKGLRGLREIPPRYYRAFDPDGIDDFREFNSMDDVRQVGKFLRTVAGA